MPDQETAPERDDAPDAVPAGTAASPEHESSPSENRGPVTVRLKTLANVLTAAVALAAILLSVWEGLENRRHNRLSVLPHLEPFEADYTSATPIEIDYFRLLSSMDSLYALSYGLENSGLGPAVVQNVLVFKEDQKIYDAEQSDGGNPLQELRREVRALPFAVSFLQHPYGKGDMLKAGEVHDFVAVGIPFTVSNRDSLIAAVNRDSLGRGPSAIVKYGVLETYSFVFCYCSVYGTDCDAVHLGAEPPVENACGF